MGTSAGAAGALAGPGPALRLPEPTGPYPVGGASLWLTDTSRRDPWAADVAVRELMVSLWYPAATRDGRPVPYMTSAESEFQLASRGITGVPPDALSKVETSAVSDAAPAGQQRGLPLVVLSPGFTGSRNTLTALAEDLASHGYVVAGIDHTYESFATAFPDGRVATCLARERRGGGFWEKVGPAGPAVAALSRGRVLFPVARLPEFGSEPCPGVSCERECPAPCPEGMRALSVEVMSPRHRDHARLSSRMDTWITDAKTT